MFLYVAGSVDMQGGPLTCLKENNKPVIQINQKWKLGETIMKLYVNVWLIKQSEL